MIYEANIQYLDSMKVVYEKEEFLYPIYHDIKKILQMCTTLHTDEDLFQPTVEWHEEDTSIHLIWKYKNEKSEKQNHYLLECIFQALTDNRSCKVELSKCINDFNTYNELVILYKEELLLLDILKSLIKETTNELFTE